MNLLEEKIKKIDVFLASKSPRRHELLKNIIPQFSIVNKDIKEEYPKNLPTVEIAKYLAELKAKAFINDSTVNNLYITADTIVVFQNKVLGKPSNEEEAFNMLSALSPKRQKTLYYADPEHFLAFCTKNMNGRVQLVNRLAPEEFVIFILRK